MSGNNMTDEIETANAEADKNSVDNNNISVEDFAMRRLGELNPDAEEPQEEVTEETEKPETDEVTEEATEESVESEEATEETEESDDVLSQLDLDDMSEEDLRELADKLGSRAVARFGELTAKRKAAEERLASLEAELKKAPNPLDTKKKVENNPFSNLDTIEKLQEKATEVDDIVEWAEDVLFQSDGYSADEVVTEVEGKDLTKADVRRALLQARKAQKTFLPDQLNNLQLIEQSTQMQEHLSAQAEAELPWMKGEDNDTRRQYEAIMSDPRVDTLMTNLPPDVKAQMPYLLAHAANSIYGRKPVTNTKSSVKLNPPKTGTPSSSQPDKSMGKTAKALKELEARFKETGSANDFANLRKLKMANRH